MSAFFLEHGLHLAPFGAVDAFGRPVLLPLRQELVLCLDGLKAPALQGRGLGVANGMLHRALAVGVAHPRRVGHHTVVRQGSGIDRVELGLVQIGLQNAFLEVIQHHVLRAAAEVAQGLLVQLTQICWPDFQTTRRKLAGCESKVLPVDHQVTTPHVQCVMSPGPGWSSLGGRRGQELGGHWSVRLADVKASIGGAESEWSDRTCS
ncbi:MAG: hypothetical protein JM57_08660 [Comamonadaceae bacterium BICA1-1]|nr:MAG: hypothetical protein JM57_08660 [Comamonadaceae bacterium BICA1-1]